MNDQTAVVQDFRSVWERRQMPLRGSRALVVIALVVVVA